MARRFVKVFESDINESLPSVAKRIENWVAAENPLVVFRAHIRQQLLRKNAHVYRALVIYFKSSLLPIIPGAGRSTKVKLFESDATSTAEQKLAAFLSLGDGSVTAPRIQAIVDVTSSESSELSKLSLLLFYDDFSIRRNVGNPRQVFIGYTQYGAIPGNSTGPVDLYDSFGQPCALNVPVRNVSPIDWEAFRTQYVYLCHQVGLWLASAPCQATAPPADPPNMIKTYRAFYYPLVSDYTGDLRLLEVPYMGVPLSTEP